MSCLACQRRPPDPMVIAKSVLGDRWWGVLNTAETRAHVVAASSTDGILCDEHASWYGRLVSWAISEEALRRSVLPGTVRVRYVEIPEAPYEVMTVGAVRRQGRPLVERTERFVAGSQLGAIVEIDFGARRARVRLQLPALEEPTSTLSTVLDSARLVHTSAQEVSDALRRRATG